MELILQLLQAVLIAVVPVVAVFGVKLLLTKVAEIKTKTGSELANKYIDEIADIISKSVMFVSQTYVDGLKASNSFSLENQKEAFNQAYERTCSMLSVEAINFIEEVYGDLVTYLETHIEAEVKAQK